MRANSIENVGSVSDTSSRRGGEVFLASGYEKNFVNRLQELGIAAVEDPVLPPKIKERPLKGNDKPLKLSSNAYGLVVHEKTKDQLVYVYDVRVFGVRGERQYALNGVGRTRDDAPKFVQREDCRVIFNRMTRNPEFADFFNFEGTDPEKSIIYDLSERCFSLSRLNVVIKPRQNVKDMGDNTVGLIMPIGQQDERFCKRYSHVQINFALLTSAPIKVLDMKEGASRVVKRYDILPRQFLETVSSQYAVGHPEEHIMLDLNTTYFAEPNKLGYTPADVPEIDQTKYLGLGTRKSIRVIETMRDDPAYHGAPAVFLEPKKTPFFNTCDAMIFATGLLGYTETDMAEYVVKQKLEQSDIRKLNDVLKGMYVTSRFEKQPYQMHKVKAVTDTIPREKTFMNEGREVNCEQYYKEKWGYTIRFPFAPLVEVFAQFGYPGRQSFLIYYPLEVITISDNQRVHQQSPELIQKIIKACAVPPARLVKQVQIAKDQWQLTDGIPMFETTKIHVTKDPISVDGRRLQPPRIEYGQGATANVMDNNGTWRKPMGSHFLVPTTISVWAAYFLSDRNPNNADMTMGATFVERFRAECQKHGMQMPERLEFRSVRTGDLQNVFKFVNGNNGEFILFLHDDREKQGHSMFKYLERKFEVTTQGVRMNTVRNVIQKNQRITLENIVFKTNMKMGGLNYSLQIPPPLTGKLEEHMDRTLYIGFQVNKPAAGMTASRAPDVVGFAANIGYMHPFEFVGDFAFSKPASESIEKFETICDIVKRCIEQFKVKPRGGKQEGQSPKLPQHVVIYRHACDDNNYRAILTCEVPLLEDAIAKLATAGPIYLTYIVPNKLHAARIVKEGVENMMGLRAPDQNIAPGTLVDKGITHTFFNEFYLCSHSALQGTAKVPRYTILHNSHPTVSFDELQRMTYHLSFGHQIVGLPTSLPSPAYIADRYASRGRMMYNEHLNHSENPPADSDILMKRYTGELSYNGSGYYRIQRVNA